jgi:spore coat protein CotF
MAMEAANPELRSFLQKAFMMSCSHAYDVWQYMVSKGYYPLEAAQPDIIGKVGGMYQVVPEDQPQIQNYLNKNQHPLMSRSGQLYQ